MFSRPHRLASDRDIKRVLTRGRSVSGRLMSIRVIKTTLPVTRFAIVTSTKVSKRAVVRNRLRRRIGERLRIALPYIAPGHDCLVRLLPASALATAPELRASVEELLRRSRLLTAFHAPSPTRPRTPTVSKNPVA